MPSDSPTADTPAWRAEYPFASNWLETDAGRLHYVDEGPRDAPVVLFVHGNPTWSFHWRRMIAALRDRFRCVAVDHLGCGLSDKPPLAFSLADRIADLRRLIESLALRDVCLVAQDWGGAIGLGAMLEQVDRLSGVVLFNTGAWPPRAIPWRIAACKTPLLGKLALQGGNLFSLAALRMTMARNSLGRVAAGGYLAPYDSWSNRRAVYEFVADIPRGPSHPTWATLAEIERRLPDLAGKPIRLVWGMRDWCFTPEHCLRRFERIWPHAETLEIDDAGHWVVEDAPRECLEALESFLANADPRVTTALPATDAIQGV